MDIPVLFATYRNGDLYATDGRFSGPIAVGGDRSVPFDDAASSRPRGDTREPVVVVDTDSLSGRRFTEGVLKSMRVRGSDIWFMTHIENADDVFDAFNTNASMVMGSYHSISDSDLRDIHSVSDSFIPVVHVRSGRAISGRGIPKGVEGALDGLMDMGFYRTCVIDTDGSMDEIDWRRIADMYPSAIASSPSDAEVLHGYGIKDVAIPHIF